MLLLAVIMHWKRERRSCSLVRPLDFRSERAFPPGHFKYVKLPNWPKGTYFNYIIPSLCPTKLWPLILNCSGWTLHKLKLRRKKRPFYFSRKCPRVWNLNPILHVKLNSSAGVCVTFDLLSLIDQNSSPVHWFIKIDLIRFDCAK